MKTSTVFSIFAGASLIAAGSLSFAHGGTYRGPGDTVPPGTGGPAPVTPGQPGVPTPPGGSGPSIPSGPRGGPPGGGVPTGPNAGGQVGTGPLVSGPNLSSWTFWWAFNRERYLNLKAAISRTSGPVTDDFEGLVGGKAPATLRPNAAQISNYAVRPLVDALRNETNRDIQTGALLALAKIGQEPAQMVELFRDMIKSSEQEVSETACLALGVLAAHEGVPTLVDIYEDTESARKLVGKREVPFRTRTFAAYGLGLIGARTSETEVRDAVQSRLLRYMTGEGAKRASQKDLRVASIIALGLIEDPDRRAAAVLNRYFEENRAKETLICSHVPNAIARTLNNASANERAPYVQSWIGMLAAPGENRDREVRQSMVQAVGMLTRADDAFAKNALTVLQDKIEKELSKNDLAAYFGLISIGQIAGTTQPGNEFEKYLLEKALANGGRVMTRAWAAIALGVEGFAQANGTLHVAPNPKVGEALVGKTLDIKDPEQLAAYGIGLGLLHYTPASARVQELFQEIKDDTYRGYFATALGLMGDQSAVPMIQTAVSKATRRPELLRECAIGLGLLGDKSVVRTLLAILGNPENKTLAVQAATATALGFVGDHRAISNADPKETTLPRMLMDKTLTAESRAFAAVAIGLVCDKEEFPWNFKISCDLNYVASTPTLSDFANQTGILNIL